MKTTNLLSISIFHRWAARVLILFLMFCTAICGLVSPFFQKAFVDTLLGAPSMVHGMAAWSWIEALSPIAHVVLAFVFVVLSQALGLLGSYISVREGILLQQIFSDELYRKMLAVRADQMGSTTVGEVVSLYATDVVGGSALIDQALPMASGILFPLVFAPLVIRWLCGIPLYWSVGVMAVIVILNFTLGYRQSRFFLKFKQLAAERTGIVNEWVQNMRLLRILGWISDFERKIFRKREEETVNRVLMVTNGQLMGSFGSSISFVINIVGVASLVFMSDHKVTPGELFALLWIFGAFLSRPFRQIPWIVTFSLDSLTSIQRLQRFLDRPSNAHESFDEPERGPESRARGLHVRDLNLKIGESRVLRDVSFDVKPGEFIAVVGEVGSGKSLLILSLIGETGASFAEFAIDDVDLKSRSPDERRSYFAYLSQEGFVMSGSLRENIGFRYDMPSAFDPEVRRSLDLAQFKLGIEHLTDGLDTEIGERGVNLSGGQRQRVGLARAHFLNRSIVLLDDCLSAVDVDTENLLLRDLIDGAWRDRTRILVTHRLTVLDRVDRVLFMRDGRIVDSGKFSDLVQRSADVREFVASVRRSEEGPLAER